MTKLTTENLLKILDKLPERPSWKIAMRTIGASESLAFNWRAQSIAAAKADDRSSPFFLEWRGTYAYWHQHAGRARDENIITYEAAMRDECLNGREEVVLGPDQRPVFVEDPELINFSEEDLWNLLGRRHRYLLDPKTKKPVPLMRKVFPPAPLRIKVLEQDARYIEKKQIDARLTGEIQIQKPLQRFPGETRPDIEHLKRLAAMSPEQRREAMGASGVARDKNGNRTLPNLAPPSRDDDLPVIEKPSPFAAPYQPPPAPDPQPPARPSYARPETKLDRGEGIGRGEPAPGGMKVA